MEVEEEADTPFSASKAMGDDEVNEFVNGLDLDAIADLFRKHGLVLPQRLAK